MKKNQLLLLLLLLLTSAFLVACGEETVNSYIVTFKDGETIIETVTVNEGEKVTYQELTDDVHDFLGWYDEKGQVFDFATAINSNTTLYAKWTNTVQFLNYDDSVLKELEVEEGEEFSGPNKKPTKPSDETYNYTFTGWDQSFVGVGNDLQIRALYEATKITYQVSFYDENSVLIETKEVVKGEQVEAPSIEIKQNDERYNYTFKGWYTTLGTAYDFNTAITSDTKLTVKYDRTPVARTSLSGMKVSMIGASISTFYAENSEMNSYYSGNDEFYYPKYSSSVKTVNYTWWYKMIKELDLTLGINNSLSGSAITVGTTDKQARSMTRINALGENGTPDIIILFIGINDNVSGVSNQNFELGYRTMLKRTIATYPDAYIILGTFYYSHYHVRMTSHGSYSEETRLAYNEIIRNLSKEYQTGLVDLADIWEAGVSPTEGDAGSLGYLGDNLHPSKKGMEKIAECFIKDIKAYFGMTK